LFQLGGDGFGGGQIGLDAPIAPAGVQVVEAPARRRRGGDVGRGAFMGSM
jgi:hypothetical protein